jgi:hypothetical protein
MTDENVKKKEFFLSSFFDIFRGLYALKKASMNLIFVALDNLL